MSVTWEPMILPALELKKGDRLDCKLVLTDLTNMEALRKVRMINATAELTFDPVYIGVAGRGGLDTSVMLSIGFMGSESEHMAEPLRSVHHNFDPDYLIHVERPATPPEPTLMERVLKWFR